MCTSFIQVVAIGWPIVDSLVDLLAGVVEIGPIVIPSVGQLSAGTSNITWNVITHTNKQIHTHTQGTAHSHRSSDGSQTEQEDDWTQETKGSGALEEIVPSQHLTVRDSEGGNLYIIYLA